MHAPDPSLPLPAPIPADAMLQAVAVPLVLVDWSGLVLWTNPAAEQAFAAKPGGPFGALWTEPQVAQSLLLASGQKAELCPALGAQSRFEVQAQALGHQGHLLTFQPLERLESVQRQLSRLEELLNLARDSGRLGVWERNVRTLEGHWDREVMRMWGLNPDAETPDFALATQNILEADREGLQAYFRNSIRQAGRYSYRFRVQSVAGVVSRVHSLWVVKNGSDGEPEPLLGLMVDDSEPFALAHSSSEIESQLAMAVDLGGISIWRHDLASARMHYSRHGWQTLGLDPKPEGLTLEEVRSLIHPEDLDRVLASAQTAMRTNQPVDVEARYRHADGSWRSQLLRRIVMRDEQGQPTAFLGVALDVTQRQVEKRRADELARRFEAATRAAGIGHWLVEPGQESAVWSDQLRVIFGLAADAVVPKLGVWMTRHVHPEDLPVLKQTMNSWLQSRAPSLELGFRIVRADGEVREVLSHSQVEPGANGPVVFGVVIDLTERRRAELALKSAEERVALAARGAGIGTWELDLQLGVAHWDRQMWALRGREPHAQTPGPDAMVELVHPEDREEAGKRLQLQGASRMPLEHAFRVIWPDGQVRWLASRSTETVDASGRRRRIGVNWDITDSRTSESVRQEREMALRESASKSQFLARMSHELRTPLNAVLGFAQLMLADETGQDGAAASRRRRVDHIRSAGHHLLTLINDVLDLAGLEGGEVRVELHRVDLQEAVEQTLPLLSPLLAANPVQVECGPLSMHVQADSTRLKQVLLNLLSNAIKYNRPNGKVRVEAQEVEGQVQLRVSDTGLGLSPTQQQHLFEPFNRLGAEGAGVEGSGIGLAIVKALVQRMGGSIEVHSREGLGTTFQVNLPVASPVTATPVQAPAAAAKAPAERKRSSAPPPKRQVLYIEDNHVNALIIGELMARRSDLTLHVAVDGASGVAQARALKPDLVLLDMQLPDFDGYEVLRRLRADPLTASVPCIALSANAMPEDIERALTAGVSDYWTKPLDFKAFMASLDDLFGKPA
jgi:PAS domain S-box-containing protein